MNILLFLLQSIIEIAETVEIIYYGITTLIGFISGWLAKRKQSQKKTSRR